MFNKFNDVDYRFSWQWIVCGYAIAFVFYLFKFKNGRSKFVFDAFRKDLWLSPSGLLDIGFFVGVMVLMSSWIGYYFTYGWYLDSIMRSLRGFYAEAPLVLDTPEWLQIGVAFGFLVYRDFASYWWHRIFHQVSALFAFHACHHSMKEMNGFSVFRTHPVDFIGRGIIEGVILASFLYFKNLLFGASLPVFTKGDFFWVMSLYMATNVLRHTMLWVPYPRWLSYIFISPAMHYIHHSVDPKHGYKNYATIFSFWDWIFGSLYIPRDEDYKDIKIGLRGEFEMKEGSFKSLMIDPFKIAYRISFKKTPEKKGQSPIEERPRKSS